MALTASGLKGWAMSNWIAVYLIAGVCLIVSTTIVKRGSVQYVAKAVTGNTQLKELPAAKRLTVVCRGIVTAVATLTVIALMWPFVVLGMLAEEK